MADASYYEAADRAIRLMDRDNLRAFNKLRASDFDQIHAVRIVLELYRKQAKKARKKYLDIGLAAYMFALELTGKEISERTAKLMAEEAITPDWIDDILSETDFVTLYRFDSETERKAQRLVEAMAVLSSKQYADDSGRAARYTRDGMIDQALKAWVGQLAQYAVNVTDYAMMQAYADAGVKEVEWEDAEDQRVCDECHRRDGMIYPLEDVPPKPHGRCRCRLKPVVSRE